MKRYLIASLVLMVGLSTEGSAQAQQAAGQPYQRPAVTNAARQPSVSPYLNLSRAGGSPAINYYGIVRPQQETARLSSSCRRRLRRARDAQTGEIQPGMMGTSVTGLRPQFMSFSHYFPTPTKQGGGLGPQVGHSAR